MNDYQRLKVVRQKLGLNQTEFAKSVAMEQGSYSAVESGKTNISKALELSLMTVHNVNLAWLKGEKGNMFNDASLSNCNKKIEMLNEIIKSKDDLLKANEELTKVLQDQIGLLNEQIKFLKKS